MSDDRQSRFALEDVTLPRHGGNEESDAANVSLADHKARLRAEVSRWIHSRGAAGATSFEAETGLAMRHQTCSARISELKRDGILVPTSRTRPTDTGRAARVLVHAEFA